MVEKKISVIHLGFPKTGNTFLQYEIFPKIMKCNDIKIFSSGYFSTDFMVSRGIGSTINRNDLLLALHFLYPDAKIIIGLRNKNTWYKSMYSQYVKNGGWVTYDAWFDNILDKNILNFNSFVDYVKTVFNDVFVYTFEDFVADKHKVISDMCNFIGVDMINYVDDRYNVSLTAGELRLGCLFNRFKMVFTLGFWFNCFRSSQIKRGKT